MKKNIGIDCQKILSPNGDGAGIEHYVWHIALALAQQSERKLGLIFFLNKELKNSAVKRKLEKYPNVRLEFYPDEAVTRQSWWPYSKYKKMSQYIGSFNLDLLHGPANVTPLSYPGKTVVTIHDLISYEHSEWFPGGVSNFFWRSQVVPKSIKNAKRVIAVSDFTKKQINDRFSMATDKIDVIYEGVTTTPSEKESDIMARFKIREPYILYIGTIEPRKNLVRVVQALARLSKDFSKLQLVISGKKGWKYENVFEKVKAAKLQKKVIFTDYVDNSDKVALYEHALAFVFPSLAEGFGLPVLDAMRSGVPVVTSNTTSLKEVAGNAAVKVSPLSAISIAAGLRKVLTIRELRQRMIERGREQAARFSWQKAAQETLATYNKAING